MYSFQQANAKDDVKRVAQNMAKKFEEKKDYESAAEYFESGLSGQDSVAGNAKSTWSDFANRIAPDLAEPNDMKYEQ